MTRLMQRGDAKSQVKQKTYNSSIGSNKCPDEQLAKPRHQNNEEESIYWPNAIRYEANSNSPYCGTEIDNGDCQGRVLRNHLE